MIRTRVIPCLLLQDGRLVKTVRFANASYVGDPVNAIKIYNEKEVDEIIVLDIGATPQGRPPDFDFIPTLTDECFMPMCYGGGVRSVEDARRLFGLGIEKVAINTAAVQDLSLVSRIAEVSGSQSVVASIDAKRGLFGHYAVKTHAGARDTGLDPATWAQQLEAAGAGELLVTSIDRDGTWKGYDLDLVKRVSESVSIPVIACGGAGATEHFAAAVKDSGASAVAAGSMVVYQGEGLGVLINFPSSGELRRVLS